VRIVTQNGTGGVDPKGPPAQSYDRSVSRGSTTWTFSEPNDPPAVVGTLIRTAGEPVQFHVEVGEETTEHTCHVRADAIDNPSNVPTAVIYSQPLQVVCQSGWQEEQAAPSTGSGIPSTLPARS
jgi:hypothetical protein